MSLQSRIRIFRLSVALLAIALQGCASPPPRPAPIDDSQGLELSRAVEVITDDLVEQLRAQNTGAGWLVVAGKPMDPITVVIDPMVDGTSGQRTTLAADFQKRIVARFAEKYPTLRIAPATAESMRLADLVMVGIIALDTNADRRNASASALAQSAVSVVSRRRGIVVAQKAIRVRNDGFDITPNKLEQDSPVVLLDRVVLGYIASAKTPPGQNADSNYVSKVGGSLLIGQGVDAYNGGQYPEAAKYFKDALADASGEQLRALNGSYLASVRLGQNEQAEQFFGRIVALGIGEHNLGIKFLFNPGSTDFWSDAQVSGLYGMWIRQLARGLDRTSVCVDLIGHASRTGPEAVNDRLSEQRASTIRRRLVAASPKLAPRIFAKGVGFRENIIGTGTDDARDAIDRRVGFSFRDCA